MPKFIPGSVIELTEEQIKVIDWFIDNPPKYYVWYYKFYVKFVKYFIFLALVACFIMGIIDATTSLDLFNAIKYTFFIAGGFGLWALGSHLFKVFYTKRYANKIGLTLKEWDWVTIGQKWDI